jgi:hypothetical protein
MTDKQRFTSVWDAIADTPQEVASMRARSALMMSLTAATAGMVRIPANVTVSDSGNVTGFRFR